MMPLKVSTNPDASNCCSSAKFYGFKGHPSSEAFDPVVAHVTCSLIEGAAQLVKWETGLEAGKVEEVEDY